MKKKVCLLLVLPNEDGPSTLDANSTGFLVNLPISNHLILASWYIHSATKTTEKNLANLLVEVRVGERHNSSRLKHERIQLPSPTSPARSRHEHDSVSRTSKSSTVTRHAFLLPKILMFFVCGCYLAALLRYAQFLPERFDVTPVLRLSSRVQLAIFLSTDVNQMQTRRPIGRG